MRCLPLALVLLSPTNAFIPAQTFESDSAASLSSVWCKRSSVVGPWDLTRKTGRRIASSCASETALFGSKITEEELADRKEKLRTLLEASEEQMNKLLRSCPDVLYRRDVVKCYAPKLLLLQKRLGMTKKDVTKLCVRSQILGLSIENLESTLDWFQQELNLTGMQLRRIVKVNHRLCGASSKTDFQKRLACIQDILALDKQDKDALAKYINRTPSLLSYQPTDLLQTRDWVKDRFQLSDERTVKVCKHRPEILISDVETLEEKGKWLQRTFQLTEEELSKAVSSYPHTITYSIEKKMQPMADFLKKTLGFDSERRKKVLRSCPALFSYSMKNNLEPKIEVMEQRIGSKDAKDLFLQNSSLVLSKSLSELVEPRLDEAERELGITNWNSQKMLRLFQRSEAQWIKYRMEDAPRGRPRAQKP